ncbi:MULTISPECIES: hypothetical protein [Vagococcus]|uniref:DUF3221 domain-containing protein n=1 Tax=Vagococcus fluvialis bH819 TaxID=1255619 RepID=A0A1X6WJW8_9ENTE|nr:MULTISPECIES: hypothetical protein [Vagococcus]SLM84527.1 hypothetical protein FM121_00445 [Vagococcus fluvialis bH819]HCM90010.1 hypothetical protein [Vagococcus sp.]
MKKKIAISLIIIVITILSIGYTNQSKNKNEIKGKIIEISKDSLIIEDDKNGHYIINKEDYPFSETEVKQGSKVVITYKDEIFETSPARFKKIIAIKKD